MAFGRSEMNFSRDKLSGYTISRNYFEIRFNEPHNLLYDEGDYLSIQLENRILSEGFISVILPNYIKLIPYYEYMGFYNEL